MKYIENSWERRNRDLNAITTICRLRATPPDRKERLTNLNQEIRERERKQSQKRPIKHQCCWHGETIETLTRTPEFCGLDL